MKKLQRQPKVIYQAPKKSKKKHFDFRMFSLPLSFGLLLAVLIIGSEFSSTPVTAEQTAESSTSSAVLTSQLLDSPTPTPEPAFPEIGKIEESLTGQVTSAAASIDPTEVPDYCLEVPVVLYHHIQPLSIAALLGHEPLTVDSDIFDGQMKYLKDAGYTTISAEQLVNALLTRTTLPDKSIMVTVDDGYDDNYTYAFLSAKKYQEIVNFMIPTGLIDKPGYMNWDHLREMSKSPYAKLYNHTTSHAPLGLIDQNTVKQEVQNANNDFLTKLGIKNDILTYPYGSYTDQTIETVKTVGIKAAFTTDAGSTQCLSGIMKLPRVRVGNAPMSEYGF